MDGFAGGTFNADGSSAASEVAPATVPVSNDTGADVPPGPLGHSLRQPFDYDAALAALAGNQKKPKDWQKILAVVADGLAGLGGHPAYAARTLAQRQNEQQQRLQDAAARLMEWRYRDWARQNEADLGAAAPFTIGRDRLAYDPATGAVQTIYDGQEDFELYAAEMGLEPGTEEYFQAVEDYVLRSSGPSAHSRDLEMEGVRNANRSSMENLRQRNRIGMEEVRQGNRLGMEDARQGSRLGMLPVVRTPQDAMRLPAGTRFRTPDGRVLVVPKNKMNK